MKWQNRDHEHVLRTQDICHLINFVYLSSCTFFFFWHQFFLLFNFILNPSLYANRSFEIVVFTVFFLFLLISFSHYHEFEFFIKYLIMISTVMSNDLSHYEIYREMNQLKAATNIRNKMDIN